MSPDEIFRPDDVKRDWDGGREIGNKLVAGASGEEMN
jgi:hypothetical protein